MDKNKPVLLSELIANDQQNTHVRLEKLKGLALDLEKEIVAIKKILILAKDSNDYTIEVVGPIGPHYTNFHIIASLAIPALKETLCSSEQNLREVEMEFND